MYYLRSGNRRQHCSSQQFNLQSSPGDMKLNGNLKIALNRLSVLENLDNHNETFQVKDDRIAVKRKYAHKVWILALLTLFSIMMFLMCFEDGCRTYRSSIAKRFGALPAKLYNVNMYLTFNGLCTVWFRKFGQSICPPLDSKNGLRPRKVKKRSDVCYNDIRDLLEEYQFGPRVGDNGGRRPLSFIEQECARVKVVEKIADNFYNNLNASELNADIEALSDYAAYDKGARVLSTSNTEPYVDYTVQTGILHYILGVKQFNIDVLPICRFNTALCRYFVAGPISVLQPWKNPGECWSFRGSRGRIQIQLSERVYIRAVTLEHIPINMASPSNIRSAPRTFSVIGIDDRSRFTRRYHLGTCKYLLAVPNVQTFTLSSEETVRPYKIVELNVESNHGNEEYTCVYRFRVHGHV